MNFEGQVVAVTGASRGIGRAIALEFAKHGAHIACIATTLDNAQNTVIDIIRAGGVGKPFGCDISNSKEVETTFEFIGNTLGDPAVLINNAGITRDTLLLRMSEEDWEQVMSVNLKGTFLCTKAVSKPMMKARYGRIVNISSIVGLGGAAGQANYAASKAGLIGFTKTIAKELGSRGITCNAIAPGFIETDMTEHLSEEMREYVINNAPTHRLGTPEDIATAVLFLASPEASYITGQTLIVDGGLTL